MTDRALLVPMSVEALVVPDGPVPAVNLAPRFDLFDRYRLGGLLRAEPWELDLATDLEEGIHLHWTLPAALTHGLQTATGDIEFAPVPNRWLVVRVAADPAPPAQTRAWIVRSDDLHEADGASDVLIRAGAMYVATKIGRAYQYHERWEEGPETHGGVLTAVGPGNPAFAAFYPGCRNVFGFHDDMATVDDGTFLYLVAGWYARREDDPLCADNRAPSRAERRQDLTEEWLAGSAIPGPAPTRTVCHATLHGVRWTRKDKELAAPLARPRFTVAVGNTSVEALAALVAAPAEGGSLWEPLLSAFQYEVLANLEVTRGIPDIDAELHRRRFHPVDGGTQWTVQRIDSPAGATARDERAKRPFPEDADVAALYNALDDAQRDHDRLTRDLASLREEYYAAWYRTQLPRSPERATLQEWLGGLAREIQAAAGKLVEAGQATRDLCGRLQAKGIRIPPDAADGVPPRQPEYELVAAPMSWFWRASDPAILLAAPGDPEAHRYQRGGRSRRLRCRVVEQVLNGFTVEVPLQAGKADATVDMPKWTLPVGAKAGSSMPFDEIATLFHESLLLDPARARAIAASAYKGIGSEQATDSPLVTQLAQKITAAILTGLKESGEVRGIGVVPDGAVASWRKAWDPLFMVWETDWAPAYDEGGTLDLAGRWELRDNAEYRWTGGRRDGAEGVRRYRGWAPLSLTLSRQIQERLRAAPGELARAFAAWSMLTQSAGGLNDALIMREHTLQLPPLRSDGTVVDDLVNLLGAGSGWSPLGPDPRGRAGFFPVRAGHVRITRLWLVDGFGQLQKVIDVDDGAVGERAVVTAESLQSPTAQPGGWIALPPRIAQPARLLSRWKSAADESAGRHRDSNANPATSPILGWIVPNHADQGLLVCDARGRVRGELQLATAGPTWSAVPGFAESGDTEHALADAPHVLGFVDGLRRAGGRALQGLLELIDRISLCITTPAARQAHSVSMLIGQPLALARAAITLEVWGRPATDQRPTGGAPNTGGVAAVRFPIRLGDVRKSADGLIGYFVGSDYTRLRPAFGAPVPRNPDAYLADRPDLELSLDAGRADVTLLMDPRAGVHLSSGILPTQLLELPGHLVTGALESMELSVRVGPVLGSADDFRVPVPGDNGGSWAWVDFDRERSQPWEENADVGKPEIGPGVPGRPLRIRDGWLSFKRPGGEPPNPAR